MKILWLDTETTGLLCEHNDIVQLSGIVDIDGSVTDEFNIFMRPVNIENIETQALAVQGRTEQEIMAYPDQSWGYTKLVVGVLDKVVDRYDRNDKMIIAGYNVQFDIGFLKQLFLRNNNKWFGSYFHYASLDVFSLASTLRLAGCNFNPEGMKLEQVCKSMGVDIEKAHDSMADIRATRDLFYKIKERFIRTEG